MPYSRINTDFRDMSNVPFNGEMVAILHQAIALPEGTKIQAQRYTFPVKEGVAYDDRTYTLLAEVPATATATPANVLVSIWLKDSKTTRLTYVGAYIVPEMVDEVPVELADLVNQDPEAGVVLSVASIGGLTGVVGLSGNVTVDAVANALVFNGLRYRGIWDAETAYAPGDIVSYQLDLWVAATTNTGSTPVAGADWQSFLTQPEVPVPEPAGINWRGQWGAGTTYSVNDGVEYKGSAYIATVDHTSVALSPPAADSAQWSLVAAAGVGVNWRGPWTDADTYKRGDGVAYQGRAYVASKEVSANTPPGSSAASLPAGNAATAGGGVLLNVGATATHEVGKAFDGDDNTYWEADADSGYYNTVGIGNVWGTMRTVEKVVIRHHPTDYHNKVPSLFFEVTSDGGATWEALPGGAKTIPGNGFGTQEMVLATPVACNGFRVKPGAGTTSGGAGYPWRVYNLEFHAQATGAGAYWDMISDKGVIWKGAWDNATAYNPDELVSYNGEAWLCLAGNTNVTPVEGASWTKFASAGGATALDDLNDVDLTTTAPADGDVLTYDGTASQWVPAAPAGGGGASALDDLTDVDTTTTAPQAGDVLTFDGTVWEPAAPSAGGSSNTAILSRVYKSGSAQLVDNVATLTKIAFETVDYDSGGTAWSTTNNEWTVPAAGDYEVTTSLQGLNSVSGSNSWNIAVYVNGTERSRMTQYAKTNQTWASHGHATVPLPNLASGDKVDVRVGTENDLNVQAGQYVSWAVLKRLK